MEFNAQIFKALSEPVRLRIMNLLLHGERCVCDLMEVLGMPQSTVSRHLAYMKNAGLVKGRRQGVWMYYRLAEGESCLHGELLAMLASCLPRAVEAENDLKRLINFLENKGESSCGALRFDSAQRATNQRTTKKEI